VPSNGKPIALAPTNLIYLTQRLHRVLALSGIRAHGSLVTFFSFSALRNPDTLPILHVGKAQSRGTVWKTSAQKIPDLSHRFRRISTFLIDESPQFHGPQIRFNHVLQLKKQPFNSGARTYRPAGPALVLVWLDKSQYPSIQYKEFKPASSARRLPRHLTSACLSSLPNCGADCTICTSVPYRLCCSLPLSNSSFVNKMMPPTCSNIRIRTARDAEIIFHAVRLGILPMVMQRLGSEERMALCSGCVYVWEERSGSLSESMEQGIERFTEGRSWGPSRYRSYSMIYAAPLC
jgi:Gti1/Pac2 family